MALVPKDTMTVADFLAWAETQDQGAFELWEGRIIAMGIKVRELGLVK